jgi:signal peptidase I
MRKGLTVGGVLTVAVCALAWLFLAPTRLGGQTTYVVTHGISMEPRFHTGDLAILRSKQTYHVGDVAAYRSATLHTIVMHRIVSENDGHFSFKGDNNSWIDPDHPTQADLLGSLELRVPQGGRYLNVLHSTAGFAVAGGLLALVLLGGSTRARRRRALRTSGSGKGGKHRAGRHRAPATPTRRATRRTAPPTIVLPEPGPARAAEPILAPQAQEAAAPSRRERHPLPVGARSQLIGAALLLVACLGGEAWLTKLPATMTMNRTSIINQTGTFSYSAKVPASVVYPSGQVRAGDPIFTQIVHSVDFAFAYKSDATMTGTVGLSAALVSANGWTTPLGTGPMSTVRDGRGLATVGVDLTAVQTALDQFTAVTGVKVTSASLVITPAVSVKGAVAGQPVSGPFTGNLNLATGASQLRVVSTSTNAPTDGTTGAPVNPLVISSPITTKVPSTGPRVFSALGHHIGVDTARIAVGTGAMVALGWLIAVLIGTRRTGRAEDDVISALRQYGDRIVDAESIPLDGPIVDLTSLAALHSIAERYDRVILHTVRGERHSYVVRDELSWYRYDVRPDRGAHAAPRHTERAVGVEGSVISLEPRRQLAGMPDILPGGMGAAAWADSYTRAS